MNPEERNANRFIIASVAIAVAVFVGIVFFLGIITGRAMEKHKQQEQLNDVKLIPPVMYQQYSSTMP